MEKKILNWILTGETGASSMAMARALIGIKGRTDHPHDPDDLNRCLMLLAAVPEAREHMNKLRRMSPTWSALVDRWDEIEASFIDEVGIGWSKSASAKRTYTLMRDVIEGVKHA